MAEEVRPVTSGDVVLDFAACKTVVEPGSVVEQGWFEISCNNGVGSARTDPRRPWQGIALPPTITTGQTMERHERRPQSRP